jgi:hypothetical protein
MKLMALALVDGNLMSTNNALTQLMRLHQICCGHVKLDDGQQIDIPSNRGELAWLCWKNQWQSNHLGKLPQGH